MDKQKIPVTLDVRKAATHNTSYDGYVVLAKLQRLTDSLVSNEGTVKVKLTTGFDEAGLCFLKGHAETSVVAICQRCNNTMNIDLSVDFAYTPVGMGFVEDEENPLPEHVDPVMVNEFGETSLFDVIEDELILAMPLIPKHLPEDCSVTEQDMSWGKIDEPVEQPKPNPFAVLKQLKRN